MKKIIYNNDKLDIKDINRVVKRAKIIFINDKNEILLAFSNNNYFLVGGHVEGDESDMSCLEREIKEEVGINIKLPILYPFLKIEYYNQNYPEENINTLSSINYYYLNKNIKPNLAELNLTEEEKDGGFKLEFISLDNVLDVLEKSLETASRKGVVLDTIEAIKTFKNIEN